MTSVSQNVLSHVSAETYNCLFCQVSHLLLPEFQTTHPIFQPDSFRVLRVQKYTIILIIQYLVKKLFFLHTSNFQIGIEARIINRYTIDSINVVITFLSGNLSYKKV